MPQKKILVIDDELIWHRLLKRLLTEYDVQTAGSCSAGVSAAEEFKPDCILLDFHLKDGDAVAVCNALRKNGKKFDVPVVVISSDPGAEITAYAECRASYFVLKGSQTMGELLTIIEKLMFKDKDVPYQKEPRIEPSY